MSCRADPQLVTVPVLWDPSTWQHPAMSSYYGHTVSRHSRARARAAETSTSSVMMMRDNSRSMSRIRAKSEFHRDSPAASPYLPSRQYGVPDYRSTSVEIRTTSPCRGAGGYYPRWVWVLTIDNNQKTDGRMTMKLRRQVTNTSN